MTTITSGLGVQIGRYEVLRHLGRGGMAEILKAELPGIAGFSKTVVIKRILPEHLDNEMFVKMFMDEARIAANLNHPNVVQVFEVDVADGFPYMTMEYVQGPTLARVLRRCRQRDAFELGHVLRLVADVCAGLDHAHNVCDSSGSPLNIVHRDVSPQNIVIAPEGIAKLLDFGVAKAAGQISETEVGTIKGKVAYAAPEQVLGMPVGPQTDVFALGVVLYEALLGSLPFQGDNDVAILAARLNGQAITPREVAPAFPEDLERIILWAMAGDCANRCPNAASLKAAIEEYLLNIGYNDQRTQLAAWIKMLFPRADPSDYTGTTAMSPTTSAEWANLLFGNQARPVEARVPSGSGVKLWAVAAAGILLLTGGSFFLLDGSAAETQGTIVVFGDPGRVEASPAGAPRLAATARSTAAGHAARSAKKGNSLEVFLDRVEDLLQGGDPAAAADILKATAGTDKDADTAQKARMVQLKGRVDVDLQLVDAKSLAESGKNDKAWDIVRRVVKQDPKNEEAQALYSSLRAAYAQEKQANAAPTAAGKRASKRTIRSRRGSRSQSRSDSAIAVAQTPPPPPPEASFKLGANRVAGAPPKKTASKSRVATLRARGPRDPRLPSSHRVRTLRQLERTLSIIERELVDRGGIPASKAYRVSARLAKHLRQSFTPGSQIIVYPKGMYWTAVDAALDGQSRSQVATLLKRRHLDGSLDRYRRKRRP